MRKQGEFPKKDRTKMEISPVAAIRIAPMVKSKDTDLGLTDVYEIERSSRAGDETYSPSGAKAGTGFEDDDDKEDDYDGLEESATECEAKPRAQKPVNGAGQGISFFA